MVVVCMGDNLVIHLILNGRGCLSGCGLHG